MPFSRIAPLAMLLLTVCCPAQSTAPSPSVQRPNPAQPEYPFDTPAPVTRPATAKQFARWRNEIRKALTIPSPLPPLAPHDFGTSSPMVGVTIHRVTYGTEFGMRIPAIIYLPEHPAKRVPGIVVAVGHGGDKTSWYSVYTGLLYAKAGAVVVTFDPLGEDERNTAHRSDARAHDTVIAGSTSALRTGGLMVTDILQSISYLRSLPIVDPQRIALFGYSMGSFQAALAASVDPRIKVLVLSGGGNLDGNGGRWDSENKPMCQSGLYRALSFLPDKGAIVLAEHARIGPTLLLNGRLDMLVGRRHQFDDYFADQTTRVSALTGPIATPVEWHFFDNAGHRPSWMTPMAAQWIHAHLHLPFWSSTSVASLGQTHIAEWAATTESTINTGYADEQREGGILAVGSGFPGISRDQLQAVPLEEWKKNVGLYVWEGWQKRLLQAEGLPASASVAAVLR